MNSLTNMDAVEKIVYLEVINYNEKWNSRVVKGFGVPSTKQALNEMYEKQYQKAVENDPE